MCVGLHALAQGAALEPHPAVLFCVSSATEVVGVNVHPPPSALSTAGPSLGCVTSAAPPSGDAGPVDEQAASAPVKNASQPREERKVTDLTPGTTLALVPSR